MNHLLMDEERFPPDVVAFLFSRTPRDPSRPARVEYVCDGKVEMKSCGRDRMPWTELGYLLDVVGAVTLAVRMVGVGRPGR